MANINTGHGTRQLFFATRHVSARWMSFHRRGRPKNYIKLVCLYTMVMFHVFQAIIFKAFHGTLQRPNFCWATLRDGKPCFRAHLMMRRFLAADWSAVVPFPARTFPPRRAPLCLMSASFRLLIFWNPRSFAGSICCELPELAQASSQVRNLHVVEACCFDCTINDGRTV